MLITLLLLPARRRSLNWHNAEILESVTLFLVRLKVLIQVVYFVVSLNEVSVVLC